MREALPVSNSDAAYELGPSLLELNRPWFAGDSDS